MSAPRLVSAISFSFSAAVAAAWLVFAAPAAAGPLEDCAPMLKYTGAPEHKADDEFQRPLCRLGYVLSYNAHQRVPDWVVEVLTVDRLDGPAKRKNNFHVDDDLEESEQSKLTDYAGTHLDRGHMAPAEDMSWDQDAMDQSFLLSNMAPQVGIGFNQHMWAYLEAHVRGLVPGRDPLVVITGPVCGDSGEAISGGKKIKRQGDDDTGVVIPAKFYKIVYDPRRKRAIAYLLPNEATPGKNYDQFIVSIDEIEEKTGIEFLPKLAKKTRDKIEKTVSLPWREEEKAEK
jgi:endonuclease G